jgi:hypothetical protein
MRALAFLAAAGLTLIALLFVADATLEKDDSPVIVTSQRSGLPETSHRSDNIHILTTAPAPAPDMTLQAVRNAQPKSVPQDPVRIHPEARAARAEALPQDIRGTQPMNYQAPMNYQYRRSQTLDRFSIRGQ